MGHQTSAGLLCDQYQLLSPNLRRQSPAIPVGRDPSGVQPTQGARGVCVE